VHNETIKKEGRTMESVETIRKVIEETVERKLAEALPVEMKFPLPLSDHLMVKRKKLKILVEIYEDTVVAYIAQDRDIFAEGATIHKAKKNLLSSLTDEYQFMLRHRNELSEQLKAKLASLRTILR